MIIDKVEDALAAFSRYTLGRDFASYCDLRTVIGMTGDDRVRHPSLDAPYILVNDNNDYVSCFEIQGAFREFSDVSAAEGNAPPADSFSHYALRQRDALIGDFKTTGHKLSLVFERDPTRGEEEIVRMLSPQRLTYQRLGLALDDLVDEQIVKMTPYLARERVWLCVWSSFAAISAVERKEEVARQQKVFANLPPSQFGQNPVYAEFEGLKMRHDAFIDKLAADLANGNDGVMLRLLDAHEAGYVVRDEIERTSTSEDWQPLLPGDRVIPQGTGREGDIGPALAPHLNYQLCDTELTPNKGYVEVDGLHYGQLAMTLAPQRPESFAQLLKKVPRQIPWHFRLDIAPGGADILTSKNNLLGFVAFVPSLRRIYDSIKHLLENDKKDPVCVMSITASTWDADESRMKRNHTLLQKAIQSWGVCSVTRTFGDPVRAFMHTLPLASALGAPTLMFPPLSEALKLAPLQRPASPWGNTGNVVFPTEDGKPYCVQLASAIQEKHTEILAGAPGSGKSLLANRMLVDALSIGSRDLPFMALIDKGFTAQGYFDLIDDSLPDDQKHKAISIVLRNDASHCRNPFDIQLGLKYPISTEREYLLKLLLSLCIDPETGIAPDSASCRQILTRATDLAYKQSSDISARVYGPSLVPDVDKALEESGLRAQHDGAWWEMATWYEVRDMLFDAGFVHEASLAQAQAVPELNDLQGTLNSQEMLNTFKNVNRPGSDESLLSYVSRCLTQALTDYPLITGRTRLTVNPETRIRVVDVNNVAGDKTPEGIVRTGIMYQFARHVAGANDFYLPQYQDELYQGLDPRYLSMHRKRIEQLDQEVKTIFIDELHNIKGIPLLWAALETEDREKRKFGVRTVFASQYLDDFPQELLESANSLYLLRVRPRDFEVLEKNFNVPRTTLNRLLNTTRGPAPDGSGTTFLAVYQTTNGNVAQLLKNTVGPRMLWALNSTPANRALRNMLYEALDGRTARDILAQAFPGGSAEKHIKMLKERAGSDDENNAVRQLADELIARAGYLQDHAA
ncbi:ATP-binding protein [Dryocola clanedunensis]|uniref:ATP-binding protein n=1 Tax=Cedecea sulfonylureivorans TaxID=3051154 RepID=UPI001927BF4A|nr:ATP-binding protein [Cedecea sulfonylureivorans]